MRTALMLLLVTVMSAAELVTVDGRTLAYDTMDCDPKRPKSCFVLKAGDKITTLKLSEVAGEQLPIEMREKIAAFTVTQCDIGLMLYEDEWIDRNGHLLKTDARFAYPKKFHAIGDNRFTLNNKSERRMTIGIRPQGDKRGKERGYELIVEPDKAKTIQMPDGDYLLLIVQETEDDAELLVGASDPIHLDNHHYTLTYGITGGMNITPVGTIAVPEELRRH